LRFLTPKINFILKHPGATFIVQSDSQTNAERFFEATKNTLTSTYLDTSSSFLFLYSSQIKR
jgi:hypothetical protein